MPPIVGECRVAAIPPRGCSRPALLGMTRTLVKHAQLHESAFWFWAETWKRARGRAREHAAEEAVAHGIGVDRIWLRATLALLEALR